MKAFVETGVFVHQEVLDLLDLYKIDYGHLSKKLKIEKWINHSFEGIGIERKI